MGAVQHQNGFKRNDGEQRADGIVDDGFPAQHRGCAGFELGLPQQRHDDRGAGDDQDCTEDGRGLGTQAADIVGG